RLLLFTFLPYTTLFRSVVFVINQIDKHHESEIPFDTFKQRVEKSIAEWEIKLDQIFYVSKFEHEHNQIQALSDYLIDKDQHRESMADYVERTVNFRSEERRVGKEGG